MGQLEIPANSVVYIDTAIVIYSMERFPDYFPLLEPMWRQLQTSEIQVMTSELTLLETLVMPLRNGNTDLVDRYESLLLSSEISLISISQTILKQAASLRSTTNLKTPDAIHAATAITQNPYPSKTPVLSRLYSFPSSVKCPSPSISITNIKAAQ